MPFTDLQHAQYAAQYARRLACHAAEMASTFDQLAERDGDEDHIIAAHQWLGAQALAEQVLEHINGLDTFIRAADAAQNGGRR